MAYVYHAQGPEITFRANLRDSEKLDVDWLSVTSTGTMVCTPAKRPYPYSLYN